MSALMLRGPRNNRRGRRRINRVSASATAAFRPVRRRRATAAPSVARATAMPRDSRRTTDIPAWAPQEPVVEAAPGPRRQEAAAAGGRGSGDAHDQHKLSFVEEPFL